MRHAMKFPPATSSRHPVQADPSLALPGRMPSGIPGLEFAVMVGSRAQGTAQAALLEVAKQRLAQGLMLTPLEQNGVLHALPVLIENAIGKAKQLLKARGEAVPISAYDAFAALARLDKIDQAQLPAWNAVIGLRNRIVHDYMNIDMPRVLDLVRHGRYEFVAEFLMVQPQRHNESPS